MSPREHPMQVVEFGASDSDTLRDTRTESEEPTSQVHFARAFARSFPWVIVLAFSGLAVGAAIGLLRPNRYVSNAKLVLRVGAREQLSSEALLDLDQRQRSPGPTLLDELHMLSDSAVFEGVARQLGPASLLLPADPSRADGPRTPAAIRFVHRLQLAIQRGEGGVQGHEQEQALRRATKLLVEDSRVTSEPGSSVILISHTSDSPERAQSIVQALVRAFIARHSAQYSIDALLQRSRVRLEEVKHARDAAAAAYIEQMSRSGINEFESQVPRLELALRSIESELFDTRLRAEEVDRLRGTLSKRLQGIPAEIEVRRPTVMIPNEDYETALVLKRALLASRQEMLVEVRPSEETRRREREFDAQIAKLDQKLATTPKTIPQGLELQENLGHSAMEARIIELDVEREALPAKIELLESRRGQTQTALGEVQKQLLTATMLRRDLASARDAEELRYVRQVDHLAFLEALQAVDEDGQGNLRVLQEATLEPEKIGPRRLSLMLKGLIFGLLAAGALVLLRPRFERRLRYPETFAAESGLPLLGVVPQLRSLRRHAAQTARVVG